MSTSGTIDLPAFGAAQWKSPVVITANLPLVGNSLADVRVAEDTNTIYVWGGSSWIAVATPGAAIAIDGLLGDVLASGPGAVSATVAFVGGSSAANVNSATTLVLTAQSGNKFLGSPANGSSGVPAFRALVTADLPVGTGTVTSVALTTPGVLYSVSGSPITSSGTLSLNLIAQTQNTILAGPTSGSSANPSFRALVTADLPAGTGTVTSVALTAPASILSVSGSPITSSGTLALSLATQSANSIWAGPTSGSAAIPTFRSLVNADLPNSASTTKTANYTILSSDSVIFADTSGGALTLTLPDPTTLTGAKIYRVIDSTGSFGTNFCTIAPHGAEKISGLASSRALQANWGFYTITTNNVDWFIG